MGWSGDVIYKCHGFRVEVSKKNSNSKELDNQTDRPHVKFVENKTSRSKLTISVQKYSELLENIYTH